MIKKTQRIMATAFTAAAAVLGMGSGSPSFAAEQGVAAHCSGDTPLNGMLIVGCVPASPEKPVNQYCESLTRADDPNAAALLGLLGANVAPETGVGINCVPAEPTKH
ncbi:hypothetical protein ACH4KO_37920 [Streptomyces anulatus]